jgi:hypothetical protein
MEKIEEQIRQAIQKAHESGYTLVCEDWGDDIQSKKCGCALGCLLVSEGIKLGKAGENFNAAVKLLGKDQEWVDSFIAGFDKGFLTYGQEPIKDAYQMGERLRAEMQPMRYHVFLQRKEHEHDQN